LQLIVNSNGDSVDVEDRRGHNGALAHLPEWKITWGENYERSRFLCLTVKVAWDVSLKLWSSSTWLHNFSNITNIYYLILLTWSTQWSQKV
jgi:hypothetical protein